MENINPMINMKLGYAYVLPSQFEHLYTVEEGFARGTLFKQLDIPMEEYV